MMADGKPELPPLWQANFTDETLDQYFVDLASSAEGISVQAKADPRKYSSGDPLTLNVAHDRLKAGDIRGIQIHYRYDNREWTDTLIRLPDGYRLVRMEVTSGN